MTFTNHRLVGVLLFSASVFVRLFVFLIVPEPHLSTNASIAYLGGAHMLHDGNGFGDPTFPVFTPPLYAILIAGGSLSSVTISSLSK